MSGGRVTLSGGSAPTDALCSNKATEAALYIITEWMEMGGIRRVLK